MTVLVIADHDNVKLKDSTNKALAAASLLKSPIDLLIIGDGCDALAKQAAGIQGIAKVRVCNAPHYREALAENFAPLIAAISKDYSHVLTAATSIGKDVMPRVAALLDVAVIADVIDILDANTFRRPFYAGNAIETLTSSDAIKLLTIRISAFRSAVTEGGSAPVETVTALNDSGLSRFVSKQENVSERPELTSARIVISGGRGMGSAENFQLLEKLASKLQAAVGASRAAVDAGFAPNDYQVGQTGKIVAPDLYIAFGISGAIQHLAGMKDSKIIVAINKDENAPIFEVADYGLVMDLFQALPELEALLSS